MMSLAARAYDAPKHVNGKVTQSSVQSTLHSLERTRHVRCARCAIERARQNPPQPHRGLHAAV
eukprot:3682326-Amphidinium_carterae.1